MKMTNWILVGLLGITTAQGQDRALRIPKADREITSSQVDGIFGALKEANFEAQKVALPIFSGREMVAYGVSIGDGKLLTKASEVLDRPRVFTSLGGNNTVFCQVVGVYPDNDLAVLKVPGLKAPAAKWADASQLQEGAFLVAMRSDGQAQSVGVLSVRERSLKASDQGFLGVQMSQQETGKGVRVAQVVPDSAAAAVGIIPGDIIVKVQDQEVAGFFELSNRLRRLRSGEKPRIVLERDGKLVTVTPTLKGREANGGTSQRLQRMDRMSGSQSRVRGDFAGVLQSDMALEAEHAGMPVVDLEGRIVGMVIARAGRISTLILPGEDIAELLKNEPEALDEKPPRVAQREDRVPNNRRDRMRRELDLMRELMENLRRELEEE